MKGIKMIRRNLIVSNLGVVLLLLLAVPQYAGAASACGPGAHWVDNCPSGLDDYPTNASLTLNLLPSGQFLGGLFSVSLSGLTTIFRSAGTTVPTHHIDTEIVSMDLTGGGVTFIAGAGLGTSSPTLPPTTGAIIEGPGNPTLADSFFDIFFELQGPFPFGPVRNPDPVLIKSIDFTQLPLFGDVRWEDTAPPIHVFSAGPDGIFYTADDVLRGQLVAATLNIPIPEPETYAMLLAGLGLMGFVARRRKQNVA